MSVVCIAMDVSGSLIVWRHRSVSRLCQIASRRSTTETLATIRLSLSLSLSLSVLCPLSVSLYTLPASRALPLSLSVCLSVCLHHSHRHANTSHTQMNALRTLLGRSTSRTMSSTAGLTEPTKTVSSQGNGTDYPKAGDSVTIVRLSLEYPSTTVHMY